MYVMQGTLIKVYMYNISTDSTVNLKENTDHNFFLIFNYSSNFLCKPYPISRQTLIYNTYFWHMMEQHHISMIILNYYKNYI